MCGRFSLTTEEQQLNEFFRLSGGREPYVPRYNGAPTQNLAVITSEEPRRLQFFRWGLIPFWSKVMTGSTPVINARAETLDEKPMFRQAYRKRRCLIPADGFYEWSRSGNKQPYRFVMADESPFAMAGLWDEWSHEPGKIIRSFAIITTTPNELMEPVHNRMPVILGRESYDEWLNGDNESAITDMLKPFPEKKMKVFRVSDLVNSVRAEGPELIRPLAGQDLFSD